MEAKLRSTEFYCDDFEWYERVLSSHKAIASTISVGGWSAAEVQRHLAVHGSSAKCADCHGPVAYGCCWCDEADRSLYRIQRVSDGTCYRVWTSEGNKVLAALRRAASDFEKELVAVAIRLIARVRWALLRRAVRARSVVVFWMGEAARSACAVDGAGRRADAAAFAGEFGS